MELAIEDVEWGPEAHGDPEQCNHHVTRGRRVFEVEYLLDGGRFRRTTPIPREVKALLAKLNGG